MPGGRQIIKRPVEAPDVESVLKDSVSHLHVYDRSLDEDTSKLIQRLMSRIKKDHPELGPIKVAVNAFTDTIIWG